MNEQQRIDHLNTIINQYESLVWLREVFKDVMKYREEMGHKEADLAAMDKVCAAKQKDLDGLQVKYKAKEAALEMDLGKTHQHYADLLAKATKQYEVDAARIDAQMLNLMVKLDGAQANYTKAIDAQAHAEKQQAKAEASMLKAIKDYEDYKTSLK